MRFIPAVFVVILLASVSTETEAQSERQKFLHDYRDGRPFQYQPSDPFVRSKTFKQHIGHGGRFYNCDGQEEKRNSPYICWKVHHEYDLPPKQNFWDCLACDIAEIKQRIRDGAGACYQENCNCADCRGRGVGFVNRAPVVGGQRARFASKSRQTAHPSTRTNRVASRVQAPQVSARQVSTPQTIEPKVAVDEPRSVIGPINMQNVSTATAPQQASKPVVRKPVRMSLLERVAKSNSIKRNSSTSKPSKVR